MKEETATATTNAETAVQPAESRHTPAQILGYAPVNNAFSPEDADAMVTGLDGKKLEKAQESALNIATQYFDFVQGQAVRAIFLGLTMTRTINKQTGEEVTLPAIVFVDATRTVYVNSGVKLVAAFENVETQTPVQITWIGTKKTTNGGQMRLFDVRILKLEE